MASSNRHWPSMFKSKPHHNQWQQHDHHRTLFSSGCEERSNEPKPRWNPKPEQIRILEAIFNSGMVNPPRDEIRRIRAQLQEYGQVGDANVFYWFQNRKSRSKQKQHRNSKTHTHTPTTAAPPPPSSSSSSSSDRSTQMSSTNYKTAPFSINIMSTHDATLNSPTASVNRPSFHNNTTPGELLPEPFFFPVLTGGGNNNHGGAFTQGFGFSEISSNQNQVVGNDQTARSYSNNNILLTDLMMNAGAMNYNKKVEDDKNKSLQQQLLTYSATPATLSFNTSLPTCTTLSSPAVNHIQGAGKSTVIINEEGYEIPSGPLNVREAFGDDAVLINSSGQPVETNEWGFTLQPLQQGAFYYLV